MFHTRKEPPGRLDPWVLGTTPNHEERFHFYEDPLKVVFNDLAVVQLFAGYGAQLRVSVHAADGLPVAGNEHNTISEDNLEAVEGTLTSPYRDELIQMVKRGEISCFDDGT